MEVAAYGGAGRQFWQVTMDEYTNLLKVCYLTINI